MLNTSRNTFLKISVVLCICILSIQSAIAQKSKKEIENERKFTTLFFDALTAKSLGDSKVAIEKLNACLEIDKKADAVWYELARLQAYSGNLSDGIYSMEKALDIESENPYYLELTAELYTGIGEYKKAISLFDKLIALKPEDPAAYLSKAEIYEALGDVAKTDKLYEKVIELTGESLSISYRKIQGYIRAGKINKAIEETNGLIEQYPGVSEILEMKADFYLMQNKQKEAEKVLVELIEQNPKYEKAALKLSFIEVQSGNFSKAIEHAKIAFQATDISIDEKMRLMLIFYESSNLDKTHINKYLELAELMTMAHPTDGKSYAIYGDILLREGKLEEALSNYQKATSIAPDKRLIWERILEIESNIGAVDSLKVHSEKCIQLFPSQPIFYLFKGLADLQNENYEAAIFTLENGEALVVNNPGLKIQFLNLLGDAATALKKYNKGDNFYEKALEVDPNNPLILNNYAYSLADRGVKLSLALKMAEKSNNLSEPNPSFLDTYAWVLFKLKEYDKARIYIQRAINVGGDESGTILEHYGDILYKQGEHAQAVEYWIKAKGKAGVSNKLEEKIEKKTWLE